MQQVQETLVECDSLLIGDKCGAHTFPYLESKDPFGQIEHEATTTKLVMNSFSI